MEFISALFIIGVVILLQNIAYSKFGMKNVTYECYFSKDEAVEGEEIELVEVVTNRKLLPLPWLKSEIPTSKFLSFADAQSQVTDQSRFVPSFFMLKSYSKLSRRWKVKCLKRGTYPITSVPLVSTDIFGNKSISKAFDVNATLVVLPKPLDYEDISVSSKYFYGDIMVKRFILPDPFYKAGVREYQQGDTMNKIHWNATARQQKLMSYNNEYTSSQNVTVVLNMQSHEFERAEVTHRPQMENAIRLCATLFDNTQQQGMPLKFVSNSNTNGGREQIETPEYFGQEHTNNLLHILAFLQLQATRSFVPYLEEMYSKLDTTDIVIVTCYINEKMVEFAKKKNSEGIHVKFIALNYLSDEILNADADIVCLADTLGREVSYD